MQFFGKKKRGGWVALKRTAEGIRYAVVDRRNGEKPVVKSWGVASPDAGPGRNSKSLSGSLGLAARHSLALLGRSEYQILQVNAVAVPPQEVCQAVRWSLKDMLEFPVDQATLDVVNIPFDQTNPARQKYMLAVVARNEVVRGCIEHLPEEIEAIDIPEMAQRNIASLLEQEGRALALLSFNDEGGLLTFTAGGELFHARQIDVTLEQMQVADEDRRTHIHEKVALDLQRSLDNFERQFPYVAVNRLLLAPFPMRAAFHDYLKSYLYLQVETFELAEVFDLGNIAQLTEARTQALAFTLLGAALRDEVSR